MAGLASSLAGCGGGAGDPAAPTVVAAFYPAAWLAREVGGDAVEVVDLTPVGAEPHDAELTARAVAEVLDAALVVYAGQGFQPQLEQALERRDGPSLDLLAGQELRPVDVAAHEGESDRGPALDPHVWLDPSRLAVAARALGAALDRPGAADAVARRLEALDARFEQGLARCATRELVTSHAAFGYLAERYDLTQVPLAGASPEAEPAPRELEALVREVERTGATTVFFEPLASPELARTVAREAGVATASLDPLEGLTRELEAAGEDYVSVMESNLTALRKALRCR